MIFNFLRQFLFDSELQETKQELQTTRAELAQSNRILDEYKQFIKKKNQQEKERVEPDFLFFVWTAISVAIVFGNDFASRITPSVSEIEWTFQNILWLAAFLIAAAFVIKNFFFAARLTLQYAKSKQDENYEFFAYFIIWGLVYSVTNNASKLIESVSEMERL